jgi:RNA polymerase sigma factor (sigma-70 family)
MATGQLNVVLRHIRQLLGVPDSSQQSDAQLLERFATRQEETAFAAILQRYGPMVLGVCRRVLHHPEDAEDAFQATFLALVRQAPAIGRREALGCWLHRVALRTALRGRANQARRRLHEQRAVPAQPPDFIAAVAWRDLQPVLDEEVQRLPAKYRVPFVLCYLEGKTYGRAAQQLRCLPSTVSRRLARARELLRRRLTQRGLTLPAGVLTAALSAHAAAAAVPAMLEAATTRAALLSAAGGAGGGAISPHVAVLAEGGMNAMRTTLWKCTPALLLLVGLIGGSLGFLAFDTAAESTAANARKVSQPAAGRPAPQPTQQGAAKKAEPEAKMTVTGRVLDAAGKPAAGADIAVIAWATNPNRVQRAYARWRVLGQGKTDAEGRFRLAVPRTSRERHACACALARAAGYGLARGDFDPDAVRPDVRVRLPREQVLHGRLVDLQGKAAAGVQILATQLHGPAPGKKPFYIMPYITFREPPQGLLPWPAATTTDEHGRFTLRGLGPDWGGAIQARDGRFARQEFEFRSTGGKADKPLTCALAPARTLVGTVTYSDTGQPVPHARLVVFSMPEPRPGGLRVEQMEGRSDGKGRFRLVPYVGSHLTVLALPPPGTPYLLRSKSIRWPKGDVIKKEVHFSLVRGILVRGRVTEKPSGKPVAGASVEFVQCRDNNPFFRNDTSTSWDEGQQIGVSGKDGTFRLAVLPGPGHLLVCGPTPDYVKVETSLKKLEGLPINSDHRYYLDAVVPLHLKPQPGPHPVAVMLRRGVTLTGQVLGPDDKPVAHAVLLCRTYFERGYSHNNMAKSARKVLDGRFELPGCDPDRPVEVFILDAADQLGSVVQLSPKELRGQPARVRLQRCGTARARLVDGNGKPLANIRCHVVAVITPGVPWAESVRRKGMIAETAFLSSLDRKGHENLHSDAQGRVTLPTLIPGATHSLSAMPRGFGLVHLKDFKAEPGKALDLGDLTIKAAD